VEFSVFNRDNINKVRAILESIRSVTSISAFKSNVKLMKRNFGNINPIVRLPDLQKLTIPLEMNRDGIEIKSLEIFRLNLSKIEPFVSRALDFKFSLERHLKKLESQKIILDI